MVIVQAGSGPKGQTGSSTVSMGGKGEGKEWRGGHAEDLCRDRREKGGPFGGDRLRVDLQN